MPVITGQYQLDAVLAGASTRWNATAAPGTPASLTYSFMSAVPSYANAGVDDNNFSVMTESQRVAVREILATLSASFNLSFSEVEDSATSYGQLRFGNNQQENTVGYAYVPDASLGDAAGDVYINNGASAGQTANVTVGTNAYSTLIHEIGHALGLKHPGNYNAAAGADPAGNEGPYLTGIEDSELYSIMSYTSQSQGLERVNLAPYDYAALAYLYGARLQNTGNDTYTLTDAAGTLVQTLYDFDGSDTIDASAVTTAITLNLNPTAPGTLSSIGMTSSGVAAQNNFSLGLETLIERAVGGSGNDTLIGNAAANDLRGNQGNDTLDGGSGSDTAVFSGSLGSYSLSLARDGSVTVSGADGTDSLTGVESLQFADGTLRLGQAIPVQLDCVRHLAKVQAYFLGLLGRAATADEAAQFSTLLQGNQGRVWWYDSAQTTMDGSLMSHLLAQPEYTALTSQSSSQIINTIYTRLTGQTAPQALTDHYVARLDAGTLRVQGVANKLLGELYLSPKGDGTLGTVAGLTDNRYFLDGAAYRGYLDHLDAVAGIDISNLDAGGNLIQLVGTSG